jgi:hypothetical protein
MIADTYQGAPALILALSALVVILPAAALGSLAVIPRRRRKGSEALGGVEGRAESAGRSKDASATGPRQASLTVEGGTGGAVPLAGPVVRIGRHEDNDIRLTDRSVHRHHAVIERTPDDAFVITDMSGQDGNGVHINGRRTAQARLVDGDVIELGRARLRFENGTV